MQSNTNSALADAMITLSKMPKIDIKGKQYASVASRVEAFRTHFPAATIETILVHDDELRVIIQAKICIGENLISTGYAEEFRGEGWINATSALENAETSAIGRSLSAFGLSGSEYASANEVVNAVSQQQHKQTRQQHSPQNKTQQQPATQDSNEMQQLGAVGLALEYHGNEIIVTGGSYGHQALLKQFHYRFDPNRKCWWKQNNQQQAA